MPDPDRFHLAGVMGWPISHSRSPLLHNYWFRQTGIKGTYVPLAIKPDVLEAAMRAMHPLGFSGCNVTIPHKQRAMEIVDELDDVATLIGAVSCVVVRDDGSLYGTNNDWIGFVGNLRHELPGWDPGSGPAAVIGAGGGARAVCYGLMRAGASEIRLVNRTEPRASAIASEFGGNIQVLPWGDRHDALKGAAMVVNTTSLGMVGQPDLDLRLDRLDPNAVAVDIIYTPLETAFLAAARARGNATVNGLGMLLHQGPPAWKLWFDADAVVTAEQRALLEESIVQG